MKARFTEARAYYHEVVSSNDARRTETAAMAQWMIGEAFFHQKRFDEAIRAYLRVDILYSHRKWRAAALLQAAKCFELENELQKADEPYSRVLAEFADTPFATQANERHEEIGKLASVRTARRNDSN